MNIKNSQFVKELESHTHENFQKPKKLKFFLGKFILLLLFIALTFGAIFSYKVVTAPEDEKIGGFYTQIKHLISSPSKKLKGEIEDRINIVLLGIGGEGHIGPLLTDTLIFLSFQPSTHKVSFISIPRDLLVNIPTIGKGKINHAYALIEKSTPGRGGDVVSEITQEIFSIPVHYYMRIDFSGFVTLIDELGGISVHVEHTLDDPTFPIPGKEDATTSERYEHFIIEKGIRHMDGETVLKYVRSRGSSGPEGSDFARSKRQQKILLAIKDKVLSPSSIFNINRLKDTLRIIYDHTDTNLEYWEMLRLYDITKSISSQNILHVVLDDGPEGPLQAGIVDGAFVLFPKKGSWSDLEYIAQNVFDQTKTMSLPIHSPINTKEELKQQKNGKILLEKQKKEIQIQIHNGTKIAGLAKKTSEYLETIDYHIVEFGNAPIQTFKKSLLYNLTPESEKRKTELLKELENIFQGIVFSSGKPAELKNVQGNPIDYPVNPRTDVLIILGEEWNTIFQKLEPKT